MNEHLKYINVQNMISPSGSKYVEILYVILKRKSLRNNTVHFVGLGAANWLLTVHHMNNGKSFSILGARGGECQRHAPAALSLAK
jgi:hypothetical protein